MSAIPQEELTRENLQRHINELVHHREEQCKQYLKLIPQTLIRDQLLSSTDIIRIKTEYRHHTGDSDYIISARVNANGRICPRAYVWEVKSPQSWIFEKKTNERAQPSIHLISAETQLLTYYDDLKKSPESLSETFGVNSTEDLCFGGIIIGSERTKVKDAADVAEVEELYNRSMRCRNYLYEHAKGMIRIMHWDEVLRILSLERFNAVTKVSRTPVNIQAPTVDPDTISIYTNV